MRACILFFSFIACSILYGQQYEFNIIHKGKNIGTLYAKKETLNNKIIYSNRTEIDTRIITKIEVDYNYKVVFEDGSLSHAFVLIMFNGREKTNTYTDKNNSGYTFYKNDDEKAKIFSEITYATVNLMFEEPENVNKVYAEEYGDYHILKKIAAHTYEKINHKGNSSYYKYKNGLLTEAQIDAGMINFKIILK